MIATVSVPWSGISNAKALKMTKNKSGLQM
jgi:hypothetical protein